MPIKAVLALSGGLDSTTLLAHLLKEEGLSQQEVIVVSFRYGSKHNDFELGAAERVRRFYQIPLENHAHVDLTHAFRNVVSSLMASNPDAIPEGHYEEDSMKATVVPGRNLIFASVLAAIAESHHIPGKLPVDILLGVHQGDHHIYPDCRPAFIGHLTKTIQHSSEDKVRVVAPFLYKTKRDIVDIGIGLNVPFHLTRTCYKQQTASCGKCGSCVERLEAFKLNKFTDPILYEGDPRVAASTTQS